MEREDAIRLLNRGSKGIEEWNRAVDRGVEIPSLRRVDLTRVDLSKAMLNGIDLRDSTLVEARLVSAQLKRTDLRDSDLWRANLRGAKLNEANLAGASLRGADLLGASLEQSDLSGAIAYGTVFPGNLRGVIGLEHMVHHGPSILPVAALRSFGKKVPEAFLRGCGLVEDELEFARAKVSRIVQFFSCFISYSAGEIEPEFETRLHNDLQARGVRCWYAPHKMKAGKKVRSQVNEAIRLHEKLLLVLSPASIASDWVAYEISRARKRELRDDCRVLFPVSLVPYPELQSWKCLDPDTGEDLAEEIREFYIPDFSEWEDTGKYREQFERLLKDLKSESKGD